MGNGAGGWEKGAVYIVYLDSTANVDSTKIIGQGLGGFTGTFALTWAWFGISVTSIGDLDQDGTTDLVVGSQNDSDPGLNNGSVWVLFMNPNMTVRAHQKIGNGRGGFFGTLANDEHFGSAVENIGDQNGDGIQDIAVGSFKGNGRNHNSGAVWILYLNRNGTVNGGLKTTDRSGGFEGVLDDGDQFGVTVAALGDLDGNGNIDIAVGAAGDNGNGYDKGAFYILDLGPETLCTIASSCGTISGNVFLDGNNNCVQNVGENGLPGRTIRLVGNGFSRIAVTNASGDYSFVVPPGPYVLQYIDRLGTEVVNCTPSQVVAIAGVTVGPIRFAIRPACGVSVLNYDGHGIDTCFIPGGGIMIRPFPCPGSPWEYCATFRNSGSMSHLPGMTRFTMLIPDGMTFTNIAANYTTSCTPGPPTSLGTPISVIPQLGQGTFITWQIPSTIAFTSSSECVICVKAIVDSPGQQFYYASATMEAKRTVTPIWTTHQIVNTVTGSCACDPNNKNVAPKGCGPNGYITNQPLLYRVNFENIGAGPAFDVVITDTLDSDLDLSSFQFVSSSHTPTSVGISGNVLEFSFVGIELLSNRYFPGEGEGFVEFKISPFTNAAQGTRIDNRALIQFDGFEIVETAPTVNTIVAQPEPLVNAGPDQNVDPYFSQTSCATLTASAIGGLPPYMFRWSTGQTGATISVCPASTSTYSVTASDANGDCSSDDDVVVRVVNSRCGNGSKVSMCHNGHTICISPNAVPAHRAHGSLVGPCGASKAPNSDSYLSDGIVIDAFPNPFGKSTTIRFSVSQDGPAKLEVFGLTGQRMTILFEGHVRALETNYVEFSGEGLAEGVYFYRLNASSGKSWYGKLLLMK